MSSLAILCDLVGWSLNGTEMRIGVFGGTFDPIHLGHLIIAEESRQQHGLEEVIFIPTGEPWMKAAKPLSSSHHRLNMVRLAIASNPFFRVSSMEIDRPGPTYTVDTLEEICRGAEVTDELHLILGIDSLGQFPRWKEPGRVLELCRLVVAPRRGYQDPDLAALDSFHADARERVVLLQGPIVDISGTDVRSRVDRGLSVRYQVPEEVESYMYRYGLYGNPEVPH